MSWQGYAKRRKRTEEAAIFAMFGAMMFATKYLMELLPNIHLLALFLGVLCVVFRLRALIPLYLYVLLDGLFHGFGTWWLAYLYIFLPLVFAYLLIPRRLPRPLLALLFCTAAFLHGLSFGVLYLPVQCLFFGLDSWDKMLAWLLSGVPFDITHAVSNAAFATLILPLSDLLRKVMGRRG